MCLFEIQSSLYTYYIRLTFLKLNDSGDTSPQENKRKKRALGLSYLIDESPPWYVCLLLGFQVILKAIPLCLILPYLIT